MGKKTKLLAVLTAACMVFGMLSVTASALEVSFSGADSLVGELVTKLYEDDFTGEQNSRIVLGANGTYNQEKGRIELSGTNDYDINRATKIYINENKKPMSTDKMVLQYTLSYEGDQTGCAVMQLDDRIMDLRWNGNLSPSNEYYFMIYTTSAGARSWARRVNKVTVTVEYDSANTIGRVWLNGELYDFDGKNPVLQKKPVSYISLFTVRNMTYYLEDIAFYSIPSDLTFDGGQTINNIFFDSSITTVPSGMGNQANIQLSVENGMLKATNPTGSGHCWSAVWNNMYDQTAGKDYVFDMTLYAPKSTGKNNNFRAYFYLGNNGKSKTVEVSYAPDETNSIQLTDEATTDLTQYANSDSRLRITAVRKAAAGTFSVYLNGALAHTYELAADADNDNGALNELCLWILPGSGRTENVVYYLEDFRLYTPQAVSDSAVETDRSYSFSSQNGKVGTAVLVGYQNGKVSSVRRTTFKIPAGKTYTITKALPSGADSAKIFVWDSFKTLKPLYAGASVH